MVHLSNFTRKIRPRKTLIEGKARERVVRDIIDILEDYRLSVFESEGPIRASIRSVLCLAGNGWEPSDNESAGLIAAALHKMGAKRPTWFQGQQSYITGKERCLHCSCELPEEIIANRERYCSFVCKNAIALCKPDLERYANRQAYARTWYVMSNVTASERPCRQCTNPYRSAYADQKFCSYDCANVAQTNPARHRTCGHCQAAFIDHQKGGRGQRYCSVPCRMAAWKTSEFECCVCSETFEAKHANARFCGPKCRNTWHYRKRIAEAKTVPTPGALLPFPTISPAVFDREFQIAA